MAPGCREAPKDAVSSDQQQQQPGCRICLCTVCTCGKHKKCDPKGEPSPSTKIPYTPPEQKFARFVDDTTYDYFYKAKPILGNPRNVSSAKTLDDLLPSSSRYANPKSDYRTNFRDFKAPPNNPITRHTLHHENATFNASTTHKSHFQWPAYSVRTPERITSSGTATSDAPFVDLTTYTTSFWDNSNAKLPKQRIEYYDELNYGPGLIPRRVPSKPVPDTITSALGEYNQRFQARTSHMEDYRSPGVDAPRRRTLLKDNLQESGLRFDHSSSYRNFYRTPAKPNQCPAVMRPKPDIVTDNHLCF